MEEFSVESPSIATQSAPESSTSGGVRRIARLGLVGVLGAAIAVFVIQNPSETEISFLSFEGAQPLWLVLVITVIATAVLTQAGGVLFRRGRRKKKAVNP